MKPVALFLVKNGIGYGHIRRVLLLADELARHGELRPVVVSQARTLDLLRTSTVPVLNLPLLHRVPSAVGEDAYLDVLDRVVARLGPAVAIEDTYPEQRYGSLDALRGVPRVLLLRRLDGESFDTLRSRGAFAPYDRVLLAQDDQDVDGEGHSGESLLALRRSDRVLPVGNVHRVPAPGEIETEKRRHGRPLVVVSGGAGGDQLHDGYGHRLIAGVHRTAASLHAAGHPARFVVVTGPYYAGPDLPALPNLTVHRFTTALPALLAAADVAVIKPGNNALTEALHGGAHLVLVPDASFLEGTDGNARRVVDRYGGAVVDTCGIDDALRAALARTAPRSTRAPHPVDSLRTAANSITQVASTRPVVRPRDICILVRTTGAATRLPPWATAIHPLPLTGPPGPVVLVEHPPTSSSPQEVVDRGTELLVSAGPPPPPVLRWLRAAPARPALPVVRAGRVAVGPHDPHDRVLQALARAVTDPANRAVVLDLRGVDTPRGDRTLDTVARWLTEQPVTTVPAGRLLTDAATRLLDGGAP